MEKIYACNVADNFNLSCEKCIFRGMEECPGFNSVDDMIAHLEKLKEKIDFTLSAVLRATEE